MHGKKKLLIESANVSNYERTNTYWVFTTCYSLFWVLCIYCLINPHYNLRIQDWLLSLLDTMILWHRKVKQHHQSHKAAKGWSQKLNSVYLYSSHSSSLYKLPSGNLSNSHTLLEEFLALTKTKTMPKTGKRVGF